MSYKSVCNVNFESQYAFLSEEIGRVSQSKIHIAEYLQNISIQDEVKKKRKVLVCKQGHE